MSIHPLDRTEEEDESTFDCSSIGSGQATAHQPLLRFCVRSLIGLSLLVFLSSLVTNYTTYGTSQWFLASGINRLLSVLLLLAFIGVLAAYRLPKLPLFKFRR